MRLWIWMSPLLLSCSSAGIEIEVSEGEVPGVEDGGEGSSGGDVDPDPGTDPNPDPDPDPEPETRTVKSGQWVLDSSELVEDECGWMEALYEVTRDASWVEEAIEYNAFLPQTFDVDGGEDTFEIRATNFGAESYILCAFEGDEFGCEMQNADSQQVVTGWPTYWEYEIDFSGSWVDENTLTGEALVTFPQSNPGDDWTLQVSGLGSPEDCEQKYRLTLTTSN